MADELPKADELGAIAPGDSDDHNAQMDGEFGVAFEFDESGMEPGLELDRSGFAPEAAEPELAMPAVEPEPQPRPNVAATNPVQPGPPAGAPRPSPTQPRPQPAPSGLAGLSPVHRALAIGAAGLVVLLLIVSLFSDSEPAAIPMQEQAFEEGERAFHQGRWIDSLRAFNQLRRFPNSEEAEAVRSQGLEARAIKEIMEAEPSSTTIRRLEDLSEIFPERVEVRERLGAVRKALSSGARAAAEEADAD